MSELILPLVTLAAAVGLTYLFCIRPMRSGHGCRSGASDTRDLDADIAAARDELERLRAGETPTPPTAKTDFLPRG